jgi:hypothetical protein
LEATSIGPWEKNAEMASLTELFYAQQEILGRVKKKSLSGTICIVTTEIMLPFASVGLNFLFF